MLRKKAETQSKDDVVVVTEVKDDERVRTLDSLSRSQAVIEFDPDGTIRGANANFLATMGYELDEIVGRHHRIFIDPVEASHSRYQEFWKALGAGEFRSGEFCRFSKSGDEVWIQATYNPVFASDGSVERVVKFASDITEQKQIARRTLDRTQAFIEFQPDGTIRAANELFLSTVGYSLEEIRGKHHRIFMTPEERDAPEYEQFWPSLAAGEFRRGEFRRLAKDGSEIWLTGVYNPIFNHDGEVVRVTKTVSDITEQIHARQQSDSAGQSIANGVNELVASMSEVASTITNTVDLARSAETNAASATSKVRELDDASNAIGKVISLIHGLSEQTNLLALNATIEAARAGEAGRGFAVVANEVKVLATQTGDAASEIQRSIEAIQSEISGVVQMISGITDSVTMVSNEASSVAGAIDEQSGVIHSMSEAAEQILVLNRSV
ncbi:MAG: PAS domain S-box protein [Ilumatobacter sp.]